MIESASSSIALESSLVGEGFGQAEVLTARLKGIAREYPDGLGILNELIQVGLSFYFA